MLPPPSDSVHPPPPVCGDDDDCDGDGWTPAEGDCEDGNERIYPGNPEVCDGWDNDCDRIDDEGVRTAWYLPIKGAERCRPVSPWMRFMPPDIIYRCDQPYGYVPACPRI